MKKQVILLAWVTLISLGISDALQAQLRPYKMPVYSGFNDAEIGGSTTAITYKPKTTYTPYVTPPSTTNFITSWGGLSTFSITPVFNSQDWASNQIAVNMYGQPICCENSEAGEFNFELHFNDFNQLLILENRILAAQRAKVERWLRKQEETFLEEINERLHSNHNTFAEAQRAFFKYYEAGTYGNQGVVREIEKKRFSHVSHSRSKKNEALEAILDYKVVDNWINCGFCSEYLGRAYGIAELAKYDIDTGPGPKFYARLFRDDALNNFKEWYYASGVNHALAEGYKKLDENDWLLNRIVDARVKHYKGLGWQERVFLMSSYLTPCTSIMSCMSGALVKYRPPVFWDDPRLEEWAKEKAPKIPSIPQSRFNYFLNWRLLPVVTPKGYYIFSDAYLNARIRGLSDSRYSSWRNRIIEEVEAERKELIEELLNQIKKWYLDQDGDGYHSKIQVSDKSPGSKWKLSTKGTDCDDSDATKTTNCDDKQKNCTKRTGLLHDANFKDKKPALGENTTTATDNFRNDSWGVIQETDCVKKH